MADGGGRLRSIPYSHHPYAYALSNPVLWTDPGGRCPPWRTAVCDATGVDPDTWQNTPEYIKGIYGLDRNASDLDVAGAVLKTPYESVSGEIQMVVGGVNLATNARARAAFAHNLSLAALGHAISQPWSDYYQGLQCRDAYLKGGAIMAGQTDFIIDAAHWLDT